MKYSYKKDLINGTNEPIIRLQKGIEAVSGFLNVELNDKDIVDWYLEAIDKVLEGNSKFEERCGNICGLKIKKDVTHVFEHLADDGLGSNCYIETEELKNLILIWSKELEKFRENEEIEYNKKLSEFIIKAIRPNEKFRNELLKLIENVIAIKKEQSIQKDNYEILVYSNTVRIKDDLIKDNGANYFNIYPQNLKDIIIKENEQKEKGENLIKF